MKKYLIPLRSGMTYPVEANTPRGGFRKFFRAVLEKEIPTNEVGLMIQLIDEKEPEGKMILPTVGILYALKKLSKEEALGTLAQIGLGSEEFLNKDMEQSKWVWEGIRE